MEESNNSSNSNGTHSVGSAISVRSGVSPSSRASVHNVAPVARPPPLGLKKQLDIDYFANPEKKDTLVSSVLKGIYDEELYTDAIERTIINTTILPGYYLKISNLNSRFPISKGTLEILKNIFSDKKLNASTYLSPLIAQFTLDNIVYQIFSNSGTEISKVDPEIYKRNRTQIYNSLHEAINFLHMNGYIHRDITIHNIVWNDDLNRVLLIDLDNIIRVTKDDLHEYNEFHGTYTYGKRNKEYNKQRDLFDADIAIKLMDINKLSPDNLIKLYPGGLKIPRHILRTVFKDTYKGTDEEFQRFLNTYSNEDTENTNRVYSGGRITRKKKRSTRKRTKKHTKKQRKN